MSNSEQTTAMLSAQVPVALRDGLAQLAREHDRSVSAEIRRAIALHLHLEDLARPEPRERRGLSAPAAQRGLANP